MYAVTGITGKVGGTVAQTLLAAGKKVRAVVRDEAKGKPWADKGFEVAIASIGDADALARAAHPRHRDQSGVDRGPEVVDTEVHRWQAATDHHADGEVADGVDDRRDDATVPLLRARTALEFRPHRRTHGHFLFDWVGRHHGEAEKQVEWRRIQHLLNFSRSQRRGGGLAHGATTTLPNTARSSMTRTASLACSSG